MDGQLAGGGQGISVLMARRLTVALLAQFLDDGDGGGLSGAGLRAAEQGRVPSPGEDGACSWMGWGGCSLPLGLEWGDDGARSLNWWHVPCFVRRVQAVQVCVMGRAIAPGALVKGRFGCPFDRSGGQ